jgi:hypothetical protein
MNCVFIDMNENVCASLEAKTIYGLSLCNEHQTQVRLGFQELLLTPVRSLLLSGELNHSSGYTYALSVSDSRLKVGYTGKGIDGIKDRARTIHKRIAKVEGVVAIFDGGWTREVELHHLLKDSRIISNGELFRSSPQAMDVLSLGMSHPLVAPMNEFIARNSPKWDR